MYYGDPPGSLEQASERYALLARAAFRSCVAYSIAERTWTADSDVCERELARLHQGPPAVDEFMPVPGRYGALSAEQFPLALP